METSRLYSLETRTMLAEMCGPYKMPANSCGPVLTHIVQEFSDQPAPQVPSGDTVNRCIVESSLCCKFELSAWIGQSEDLALAFDGSKHKGRNHVDIIIGGKRNGEEWCACYAYYEYSVHPNVDMLVGTAVAAIEEIANFQQQQGMPNPTHLVDFKSITADNCSENMGEENGVIAKIQQHRKAQWEELFPNIPYEELIIKGCTDHIMALIPQHFQKMITT